MDIQKFLFIGWCPKMAHNYLIVEIKPNHNEQYISKLRFEMANQRKR
jgi:hypothetical protein